MLQDDANTTMTRLTRTVFKRSNSACWFVAVLLASVATRAATPYESRWESLDKRPMPGWFNEAHLGARDLGRVVDHAGQQARLVVAVAHNARASSWSRRSGLARRRSSGTGTPKASLC